MRNTKELLVRIRANSAELEKTLDRAERRVVAVGRRFSQVGKSLTTRLTLPIVGVGTAAVAMASRVEESENLFSVAMKGMEDRGRAFADRLQDALGVSAVAVRENVATLFQMTESMGLTQEAAFGVSTTLAQLTQDMASLRNERPEDIFRALTSGLSGEAEPLKRRGILITENAVRQRLLEAGLIDTTTVLTEQQKVLGRYIAIIQQTRNDQGDLARTQESLANTKRRLTAAVKDLAARFGTTLLPVAAMVLQQGEKLVAWADRMVERWEALSPKVRAGALAFAAAAAGIGPLLVAVGGILKLLPLVRTAFLAFTGPVGLTVAAVGALTTAGVLLYRNWDVVKVRMALVWAAIKDATFSAVDAILGGVERLTSRLPGLGAKVAELRQGFQDFAEGSLAASGQRIAELEAQVEAGLTPAVDDSSRSVDDWRISLEGATAAFRELGIAQGEARVQTAAMAMDVDAIANRLLTDTSLWDPSRPTIFWNLVARGADRAERTTGGWANQLASTTANLLTTGRRTFREWADAFVAQISRMIAKLLVFRALSGFLNLVAPGAGGFVGALQSTFSAPFGGNQVATPTPSTAAALTPAPAAPGIVLDLGRLPPPQDPRQAARDPEWLNWLADSIRAARAAGAQV